MVYGIAVVDDDVKSEYCFVMNKYDIYWSWRCLQIIANLYYNVENIVSAQGKQFESSKYVGVLAPVNICSPVLVLWWS